jgi:hypothetical protein
MNQRNPSPTEVLTIARKANRSRGRRLEPFHRAARAGAQLRLVGPLLLSSVDLMGGWYVRAHTFYYSRQRLRI